MHIHLDLLGGISGDMFIGGLLDCFPGLYDELPTVLDRAGFSDLVKIDRKPFNDGVLTGTKFSVSAARNAEGHDHRHFSEITTIIRNSDLESATSDRVLAIFRILAEAEGEVHGTEPEKIAFHEVGAWDSITDVVCAAWLIDQIDASSWSVSSLPMGRGRVNTAHGLLPVPAPATALLLKEFTCHDDGRDGERITPTGAAILKHLSPTQAALGQMGALSKSGYGFGSKRFEGLSNVLRVLSFSESEDTIWNHQQILQINFEIDDQTSEELSIALERIRQLDGVLDVQQSTSLGKKNRQFAAVQILARSSHEQQVLTACFEQTTTIGIRTQSVNRVILNREEVVVNQQGSDYRAKLVRRPGGPTVKAEMDDLQATTSSLNDIKTLRQTIEHAAQPTKSTSNDQ